VVDELSRVPDWDRVLDGSTTSPFIDPGVVTTGWPDRAARTPAEATALLGCGKTACTTADLDARTAERPWGPNNPRWQLFAYGPLSMLDQASPSGVLPYVAAWVADDPSENDGLPLLDGDTGGGPNPGRGVISVLAHAYGASGTRRVVEATVARTATGVRVLSWRDDR
jgi:hypothetical protein